MEKVEYVYLVDFVGQNGRGSDVVFRSPVPIDSTDTKINGMVTREFRKAYPYVIDLCIVGFSLLKGPRTS